MGLPFSQTILRWLTKYSGNAVKSKKDAVALLGILLLVILITGMNAWRSLFPPKRVIDPALVARLDQRVRVQVIPSKHDKQVIQWDLPD